MKTVLNNFSIYLALVTFFIFTTGNKLNGQSHKSCKFDNHLESFIKQNPEFIEEQKKLKEDSKKLKGHRNDNSYVVPVVFHVFGRQYNGGDTLTDAIIKDALHRSNEDFKGLAPGYDLIDAPWDTIKKTLDITFELARLDEHGNPTSGIIYYNEASGMGHYSSPEVATHAWDNYKYCNIYITRDLYDDGDYYNSGVAWLPSVGMSDDNLARVVYNGSYLGSNTNENFRSVFTHEFGHYLNLRHTFNGGCNSDPTAGDHVEDTPPLASPSYDCIVQYNCFGDEINSENFMDYTDCYDMYTTGQVERMENALINSPARNTLWTTSNLEATGTSGTALGARIEVSKISLIEMLPISNGGFDEALELKCIDCNFAVIGQELSQGVHFSTNNLPSGYAVSFIATTDSTASISFINEGGDHSPSSSVNNVEIIYLDPLLTNGVSQLYKNRIAPISIVFNDPMYCNPSFEYAVYSHIVNVKFGSIDNSTGYSGYIDYKDIVQTDVEKNSIYNLEITLNKGLSGSSDNVRLKAWFDWNNNYEFEEDELVNSYDIPISNFDASGNIIVNIDVPVPLDAIEGNTAFRVFNHFILGNEGEDPCSTVDSGEAEDYGINILSPNNENSVDFFANKSNITVYEFVDFTDFSTTMDGVDITNWQWTFENGMPSTSNQQNPQGIQFPEEGLHAVTMTATLSTGETISITKPEYINSRIEFCDVTFEYGGYINVSNVMFLDVDHSPAQNTYTDYSSTITENVTHGTQIPLEITLDWNNGGVNDINHLAIYVDWDYNSLFTPDELLIDRSLYYSEFDENGVYIHPDTITVPQYAEVNKLIRLRVLSHYEESGAFGPCSQKDSGNGADYGLILDCIDDDNDGTCNIIDNCPNEDNSVIGTLCDDNNPCTENDVINDYCECVGELIENCEEDCIPSFEFNIYSHIVNVNWDGAYNNSSENNVYTDYSTTHSATVLSGNAYNVSITTTSPAPNDDNRLRIWCDWNQNNVFESSELEYSETYNHLNGNEDNEIIINAMINVPENVLFGFTKMRILQHYVNGNDGDSPCGSVESGEAEDYGLTITENTTGQPCDDGDPCTINDAIDSDGNCVGTYVGDNDGDGVCDSLDQCPGFDDNLIGTTCDDGDPCTDGETYDDSCGCSGGAYVGDNDGDGVCDSLDQCPGFDDNLIGTTCDDGDPCTDGETYDDSCGCSGGAYVGDNDGDGVCNSLDQCPGFDDNLIGTTCDDGDPCTDGETYDDSCGCSGGAYVGDNDGDGVCNSLDQCPGFDDNLIGTTCDDGDPCTDGETYDDSCGCSGGAYVGDNDGDGVCNSLDQCPGFDDNLIGTTCDDGDPCTDGETYDDSCGCSGGAYVGDNDGDGVCNSLDQCPGFDDNLIGTTCDDGDPCTDGETYDDSCGCSGGAYVGDNDGDGVCNSLDQCPGFDDNLIGTTCDDGDPCTDGETYDDSCGCSGGAYVGDNDGDGVCNSLDQCPDFDDNLIGTACDDSEECTENDIYQNDCTCSGEVIENCNEPCEPSFFYSQYSHIVNVSIDNYYDNSTSNDLYTDYTDLYSSSAEIGSNFTISITTNPGNAGINDDNRLRIWCDWNQDGIFSDDELVYSLEYNHANGDSFGDVTNTATISIPQDTPLGNSKLRVLQHYVKGTDGDTSCGMLESGEAEDYGLDIESCEPSFFYSQYSHIVNVSIDNYYDNSTSNDLYTDYTDLYSSSAEIGSNFTISITTNPGNAGINDDNRLRIWCDWNQDGIFSDDELVYSLEYNHANGDNNGDVTNTATISIPQDTPLGNSKLRVLQHYVKGTDGDTSCGMLESGEAEDYGLDIESCEPSFFYSQYSHIVNVSIDNYYDNSTSNDLYTDYTDLYSSSAEIGSNFTISITTNPGNAGINDDNRLRIWCDWNQDGIFSDDELVYSLEYNHANGDSFGDVTNTATISIPQDTPLGNSKLRVLQHYVKGTDGDTSCGMLESGEAEDYGLDILDFVEIMESETSSSNSYEVQTDNSIIKKDDVLSEIININENEVSEVVLYPNPANNIITIEVKDKINCRTAKLEIFNSLGESIVSENIDFGLNNCKLEYSVSNLEDGAYFVRMTKGTNRVIKRLLVIH